MKFPPDVRFVAIEGVIGAGKTTLSKIIAERSGGRLLQEEFEENPFLEKFYKDKSNFAFQTQLFFLLSRHRQFEQAFRQNDLFDSGLTISDYTFDKDKIFASLNLSDDEHGLYLRVMTQLEKEMVKPDFIVYLQASVPTLLRRIKKRDRPMERGIDEKYLSALCESYSHHLFHVSDCPVMMVNTDNIDFVENPADLEDLLREISKVPPGISYYSPVSLF